MPESNAVIEGLQILILEATDLIKGLEDGDHQMSDRWHGRTRQKIADLRRKINEWQAMIDKATLSAQKTPERLGPPCASSAA